MEAITLKGIKKVFHMGDDVEVHALRGIDLSVNNGEFVAIMGTSGSGKSTLLNIIGCLDYPSEGSYTLDGVRVNGLDRRQLADIRNQKIGFVFQGFNLLPRTTALENVELPLLYDRSGRIREPHKKAISALEQVGLGERLYHEPHQLSGGQQQRVAVARALVNEPAIILADEPTGNLDTQTSLEVMKVFKELHQQGITIVLVTHEEEIAHYAKRVIRLRDGKIVADKQNAVKKGGQNEMEEFN
jgi:putative ABC transport system ATP-binding protein